MEGVRTRCNLPTREVAAAGLPGAQTGSSVFAGGTAAVPAHVGDAAPPACIWAYTTSRRRKQRYPFLSAPQPTTKQPQIAAMQTLARAQLPSAPARGVAPRSSVKSFRVVRASAVRSTEAPLGASRREILSVGAAAALLPALLAQQPAVAGGGPPAGSNGRARTAAWARVAPRGGAPAWRQLRLLHSAQRAASPHAPGPAP
jgi:hypothetical protein